MPYTYTNGLTIQLVTTISIYFIMVCDLPPKQSANSNPRGKPQVYSDCVAMQRVIKQACLSVNVKAVEQAQLARAYVELEKLKRITRGLPANTSQSIREPAQKKHTKSAAGPLESLPETKPKE